MFQRRNVCPACKSELHNEIYSCAFNEKPILDFLLRRFRDVYTIQEFSGEKYVLNLCKTCGLIFQRDILKHEFLEKLYGQWLIKSDSEMDEEILSMSTLRGFFYYQGEMLKIIKYLKKDIPSLDILDYGMGRGMWCKVVQAMGINVHGTDLSENSMADARQISITTVDVNNIEMNKYDFINTEQVFEHLAEPLEVLKKLRRSLKDSGIIRISVPNGRGIERRLDSMDWNAPRSSKYFLIPVAPLFHINTFKHETICQMGKIAGFQPINLPLRFDYLIINCFSLKDLLKSLIRPIYRRINKSTCVYLMKV